MDNTELKRCLHSWHDPHYPHVHPDIEPDCGCGSVSPSDDPYWRFRSENRPKGMSQVDWLWLNYKQYNVANEPSQLPSDRLLLTEKAITSLIRKATGGGVTGLLLEDDPADPKKVLLKGLAVNGEAITMVSMPKEEHIATFCHRRVTSEDVSRGATLTIGEEALVITTNLGTVCMVGLKSLGLRVSGKPTDTVHTDVTDGVVSCTLKVDEVNNLASPVRIQRNSLGIWNELRLDNTGSGVKLEATPDGLKASITIEGADAPIRFAQLTIDEYLALGEGYQKNVLYIITDRPFMYLNGMRYGVYMLPGDYPIVSLTYDKESMTLYYKKADGTDIQPLVLGAASAEQNGMMTVEQYEDLQKLLKALEGVDSVQEYVKGQVKTAGLRLKKEKSDTEGKIKISLLDGDGNELSHIQLAKEVKLKKARLRKAKEDDLLEGGLFYESNVEVGDYVMIFTLTDGQKIWADVNALSDVYEGLDSKTVSTKINKKNRTVKASVILPEDEKILSASAEGLRTKLSVKRVKNKITVYGNTEEDKDKIGEFVISDQLLEYTFVKKAVEKTKEDFPPAYVNGAEYDELKNPVIPGHAYVVLTMGIDSGDTANSYKYNLYIDVTMMIETVGISSDCGNLITMGTDGRLYAAQRWRTPKQTLDCEDPGNVAPGEDGCDCEQAKDCLWYDKKP